MALGDIPCYAEGGYVHMIQHKTSNAESLLEILDNISSETGIFPKSTTVMVATSQMRKTDTDLDPGVCICVFSHPDELTSVENASRMLYSILPIRSLLQEPISRHSALRFCEWKVDSKGEETSLVVASLKVKNFRHFADHLAEVHADPVMKEVGISRVIHLEGQPDVTEEQIKCLYFTTCDKVHEVTKFLETGDFLRLFKDPFSLGLVPPVVASSYQIVRSGRV